MRWFFGTLVFLVLERQKLPKTVEENLSREAF